MSGLEIITHLALSEYGIFIVAVFGNGSVTGHGHSNTPMDEDIVRCKPIKKQVHFVAPVIGTGTIVVEGVLNVHQRNG